MTRVVAHKGIVHSPALKEFLRQYLTKWDCSKLRLVGFYLSNRPHGLCCFPRHTQSRTYHILVSTPRGPSYKIPIGMWTYVKSWRTYCNDAGIKFYDPVDEYSEPMEGEDIAVWIFGHEMFHFLRHSRQVPGQNTQNQANGWGFKVLAE